MTVRPSCRLTCVVPGKIVGACALVGENIGARLKIVEESLDVGTRFFTDSSTLKPPRHRITQAHAVTSASNFTPPNVSTPESGLLLGTTGFAMADTFSIDEVNKLRLSLGLNPFLAMASSLPLQIQPHRVLRRKRKSKEYPRVTTGPRL